GLPAARSVVSACSLCVGHGAAASGCAHFSKFWTEDGTHEALRIEACRTVAPAAACGASSTPECGGPIRAAEGQGRVHSRQRRTPLPPRGSIRARPRYW